MAWFGKVSLGGLQDIAGAVSKLSESVKNIEKNFDSALGLEDPSDVGNDDETSASGSEEAAQEKKGFFDPVMAFMVHKADDNTSEVPVSKETVEHHAVFEENDHTSPKLPSLLSSVSYLEKDISTDRDNEVEEQSSALFSHGGEVLSKKFGEGGERNFDDTSDYRKNVEELSSAGHLEASDSANSEMDRVGTANQSNDEAPKLVIPYDTETTKPFILSVFDKQHHLSDSKLEHDKLDIVASPEASVHGENASSLVSETIGNSKGRHNKDLAEDSGVLQHDSATSDSHFTEATNEELSHDSALTELFFHSINASHEPPTAPMHEKEHDSEVNDVKPSAASKISFPDMPDTEKTTKLIQEIKMMEAALQGAARQAQAKAEEIVKLMNENENLRSTIDDLKRKFPEAEVDLLKEEYHQRVASLERKVYALTKERDVLRREQNRKSDAAALLKEKDEIISQVMAEGEELSKKQAAQEATMRKLRAQIRELEEEKQRLNSKLQVEETKVESIKKDKAVTERLLQETIERNQAELTSQKDFYTSALNDAREALALAEARINNEAKIELESRLREAAVREALLVQTLEEMRNALTRKEQETGFKEEMLKRDIDDLQKRCQASELRYNELVTQVPESTRPLLRQIEAMQEAAARKMEAWAGVERVLMSRLQEAEAKAAAAEERERSLNERLSQSASRITILETQITILRTEQTQLGRSLEKERQRASENRQEYLAVKEEAVTQEGHVKQLEDEIKDMRVKHKREMQEAAEHRELLEKELEREKCSKAELEKVFSREENKVPNQNPMVLKKGNAPVKKLSNAGSANSVEQSLFLQSSLDNKDGLLERGSSGESNMNSYFIKSMTPSAFESALRHKDGEIASYTLRLASMESIRHSLAEELVKMTEQCEKLRIEAGALPGVRAELEALRRRHSQALELMGERDESLEELRADIEDLKEMYREQVELLANKIQALSST